jgi:hypothetical protein
VFDQVRFAALAVTAVVMGGLAVVAIPVSAGAAACAPGQILGNSGFESGSSPWSASSGVIGSFSGESAHSGTRFAWLDGYGSSHTDTLSQQVTLDGACASAVLTYWLHVDTAETTTTAHDTLSVKVGSTTLVTYSNLDAGSGFVQRSVDLHAYLGQTVTLTFSGVEDAGLQTSFVVDDTALSVDGGGGDGSRSPDQPSYDVSLTSNAAGSQWSGHVTVGFRNPSSQPLTVVYLRTWDNRTCSTPNNVVVSNVSGGAAGASQAGCTAVPVTLTSPVGQNGTGSVGYDVTISVPSGADRFGADGAYDFVGNAIPVLGVRDAAGQHLDPYTNNGESFYSLAGSWTVRLTHPSALKVATTGTSSDSTSGSSVLTTATATNVRDFAWVAGPFSSSSTVSPGGVTVRTWWTSGISASAAASMQSLAAQAIDAHGARFGAYPYGEVDLVLDNNFWFGGMEYPGLVLSTTSQTAVVHELAHQWWYGIVGDDEYSSPWLDESFADYATDLYFGQTGSGCGITWASSAENLTNPMAYWDAHSSRYSTVVYGYGKCTLHDLERLLGSATMQSMLRSYAQAHWYGVTTTADFKAAAQAATSTDLTSFWTQHRVLG